MYSCLSVDGQCCTLSTSTYHPTYPTTPPPGWRLWRSWTGYQREIPYCCSATLTHTLHCHRGYLPPTWMCRVGLIYSQLSPRQTHPGKHTGPPTCDLKWVPSSASSYLYWSSGSLHSRLHHRKLGRAPPVGTLRGLGSPSSPYLQIVPRPFDRRLAHGSSCVLGDLHRHPQQPQPNPYAPSLGARQRSNLAQVL